MKPIKLNRKKFLKLSAAAVILPFLIFWDNVVKRTIRQISTNSKIILPANIQKGISFHKSLFINNDDMGLKIYSAKCTHLGCRITKIENEKLICPCHGSEFDLNGNVMKGPASVSLKKLDYKTDKKTKEIIVFDA